MAMMCANRKCGRRENTKTDLCLVYLISFWLILKISNIYYVFRGLESGVGQLTNDKAYLLLLSRQLKLAASAATLFSVESG
jgi:hypothetical protein